MSRIGKKSIKIPNGVEVTSSNGTVKVKGSKGELSREMDSRVSVAIENGEINVTLKAGFEEESALWGTNNAHIKNLIEGVTKGFEKNLQIEGIGYKGEVKGSDIVFGLGFSHPVTVKIPQGIKATFEKNILKLEGIDKEVLGAFAAKIRDFKKPEPYKGKGIRYVGEYVPQKQGKKSA